MGDVVGDRELSKQLYAKSADTLIIDNQKLVLETDLARDFFPGGMIQRKSRLFVSINVVNTDILPITGNIETQTLYVINKDQIWISNPELRSDIYIPAFKAYWLSRNGPEWETGIFVDAIVSVKDLKTSEINYLIARNQKINRLD